MVTPRGPCTLSLLLSFNLLLFQYPTEAAAVPTSPLQRTQRQSPIDVQVSFVFCETVGENCSLGLTHNTIFVLLEYRILNQTGSSEFIYRPDVWQPLAEITGIGMDANDTDPMKCKPVQATIPNLDEDTQNYSIQLRLIQREHGGGKCNCWEVRNTTFMRSDNTSMLSIPVDLSSCPIRGQACLETGLNFCDGSASEPRGVISLPLFQTQFASNCTDVASNDIFDEPLFAGTIDECGEDQLWIQLDFSLNMKSSCNRGNDFDEGIEVAIRSEDGPWTPIAFYARKVHRSDICNVFDGHVDENSTIANIRGYNVSLSLSQKVDRSLNVCRGYLEGDNVQFRWLQTASLIADMTPRDVWILDDVSITLHQNGKTNITLIEDNFNSQDSLNSSLWNVDIRNGLLGDVCGETNNTALVFGTTCATVGCGTNVRIVVSRLVTTAPLNISSFLEKTKRSSETHTTLTTNLPQIPSSTTPSSTTLSSTTTTSSTPSSTTPSSITPSSTTPSSTTTTSSTTLLSTTTTSSTPSSTTPSSITPLSTTPLSTTPSSITPLSTTPSSTENTQSVIDPDVFNERAELMSTLTSVLSSIDNDEELKSITLMPPAEATQSLSKLVNDRKSIDETVVAYLLSDILNGTENLTSRDEEMESAQSFISITNQLILRTLNKISERSTIAGSTLLSALDQFIFTTFSGQLASGGNVELVVSRVFYNEGDRDESLFTTIDMRDNSLKIPRELLRHLSEIFKKEGPFTTVSYLYSNLSGLLPGSLPGRNDTQLASSVISASIQQGGILYDTSGIHLRTPVIITLSHNQLVQDMMVKDSEAKVYCVFWEFILQSSGSDSGGLVSGRWNTDGCKKNDKLSDTTKTVCECTHLTNFAILLSARPIQDPTQALVLGIIGYIGVTLSVAAMIVTIFILIFLRSLWSMRNFIHINLCISLTLAQLTFVIGVTPHGGGDLIDPGCRTAAVLIQFFFLVSFMWMLMEGVVLYIALVKVFTKYHRQYMIGFALASYGVPILYMVLCVPLGFAVNPEPDYGYIQQANDTLDMPRIVCWLNPYTNFFLTFLVPVVVIILLNIGFFIMAISIMYKHSKKQMHKSAVQNAKYWLRSSISLLTIMGLTWLVGVLVFDVQGLYLIPFAYIFTICVAFQGIAIFVIFVPLSKQVRDAYSKWWKVKVAESDFLSKHFGDMSFTTKKSTAKTGVSTQTKSRNTLDNQPKVLTIESSIAPKESFMETAQKENDDEDTLTRLGTSFDVWYIIRPHDYQKEDLSEESGDVSMGAGHHHQPNSSNMLNRTLDSRNSYKKDLTETTEEGNNKKDTLSLSTKDYSQRLTTLGSGNRDAVGLLDEAIEMKDDPLHESLASDRTQDSCLDCHCNAHMQDQLLTTAVDGAIFINQAVLEQDSECVTISKL